MQYVYFNNKPYYRLVNNFLTLITTVDIAKAYMYFEMIISL